MEANPNAMTSAAENSSSDNHHLHIESLPLIDLRLLSQSELYSLSLCSSSSSSPLDRRCDDDVVIPKIDRSVFNESAGSRKQTFSRLRLAPRNSQMPPSSSSSIHIPCHNYEPVDEENAQIVGRI
ncbi:Methyl-CpG-binding domain-containing protein 8 [Quillaja saponaria]|uniref:Methyl-CpG-binding domain-containing protein 8 n=1 Tax=Quillaja saponaria TaxID=32244 RepID=A0AAD7LWP0_QUISA|nr:Methyl-CpG-binding domain-containing protein 8 [Quillaja saponaria]